MSAPWVQLPTSPLKQCSKYLGMVTSPYGDQKCPEFHRSTQSTKQKSQHTYAFTTTITPVLQAEMFHRGSESREVADTAFVMTVLYATAKVARPLIYERPFPKAREWPRSLHIAPSVFLFASCAEPRGGQNFISHHGP